MTARSLVLSLALALAVSLVSPARAAGPAAATAASTATGASPAGPANGAKAGSPGPAVAKAGGGQSALAVGFDAKGALRARVCPAAAGCSLEGATEIAAPADVASRAGSARLTIARLGPERRAIVVELPGTASSRPWAAIVAAPLRGAAPLVVWSGETGPAAGVEGERSGERVLIRPEGVYVGTEREGRDLCGRAALLAPRAVDPATLTLKPAKLQRLTDAEREQATRLVAKPADAGSTAVPLLHAVWATSAKAGSSPRALTDGDGATAWLEDRGGAGRGELVVASAPREVPIAGFELVLPSPPALAPMALWLVTDAALFEVTVPSGVPGPGANRIAVELPAPVRTSCVALVLEESGRTNDHDVGVAELVARPAVVANVSDLVRALSGGGPDAEAAGAVLASSGPEALVALRDAFPSLDEGGRRVALHVLDGAACSVALPAYVAALSGPFEAHKAHVQSTLRRCPGAEIAAEIGLALQGAGDLRTRASLVDQLTEVAPAEAVPVLLPLLSTKKAAERRVYRAALARVAGSTEAASALARVLGEQAGEPEAQPATLEILRALSGKLDVLGEHAEIAFTRLARPEATFRTRYLLLGVAAELAPRSGSAQAFLKRALGEDPSSHVRAEAARVVASPAALSQELVSALGSPDVRVREAAAVTLGRGRVEAARAALEGRLEGDPWPLVRSAAARALGGLGPSASTDAALLAAVADDAKGVRRASLLALGQRGARGAAEDVLARLEDAEEDPAVRSAAAAALGMLCWKAAIPELTRHAERISRPPVTEADLLIGGSAVTALANLGPPDLRVRLAPLRAQGVPASVGRLAEAALSARSACRGGVAR